MVFVSLDQSPFPQYLIVSFIVSWADCGLILCVAALGGYEGLEPFLEERNSKMA